MIVSILLTALIAASTSTTAAFESPGFVQSIDECGGVLDGLAGAINYKVGKPYDHAYRENCIWTIRTELKGTIQLELIEDGFSDSYYPIIQVSTLRQRFVRQENVLTLRKGDRKVYNVSGPLIYVQFVTRGDLHYPGTGFSLVFRGIGRDISGPIANRNYTYGFKFEKSCEAEGTLRYPALPATILPDYELFSMTLHPQKDKLISLTILAPIYMGYDSNQNGYFQGCSFDSGPHLLITEHEYFVGPNQRLSNCRTEPYLNTTVISPHPLVFSFYTDSSGRQGFQFKWENVVR